MSPDLNRRQLLKLGAAAGAFLAAGPLGCSSTEPDPIGDDPRSFPILDEDPGVTVAAPEAVASRSIDYRAASATPTVCFGCTTHCGVIGWVQDGRVRRISGNPLDPNSQGKVCAKAQGMISYTYDPGRILYPLRRVGKRGEGKWERISWDDALEIVAARMKVLKEQGHPERFVFHYGRDKTKGYTSRFTDAFGTPHRLNRRSICSSNRRAPLMSFYGRDFEWESQDVENTRLILNFGGNPAEAYQGGMFLLTRLQGARVDGGARLVTFEVRPSATASVSDEFYTIAPGTDGLVALAMARVIIDEELYDKAFFERWSTASIEEVAAQARSITVEQAAQRSGVAASAITRLAREFAAKAPAVMTMSNRGSAKHENGAQSDRCIRLLDVLVGSVGKVGGFCLSNGRGWSNRYGQEGLPKLSQPGPKPPKIEPWRPGTPNFEALPEAVKARVKGFPEEWQAKYYGELATPSEYPLSWHWYNMRVGQLIYPYIKEGRQKVDVYMSYTLGAAYGYPEARLAREVLLDEELIPFHVAIDISYSEQAALADLILPEATSLERWDAHGTNSYALQPYVGIRQPLAPPLGESRSIQVILRDLARRIGGGVEAYFAFDDIEAFYEEWHKNLPISWEDFKRRGIWYDPERPKDYELYERPVPAAELEGSVVDEATGVITKDGAAIGVMQGEQAVRGFPTPSRKIQVKDEVFAVAARAVGMPAEDPQGSTLPCWFEIPGFEALPEDRYVFTTFKWNVHTQGRSANWKYSAEVVHTNPLWMNPETAARLGLEDGAQVELTVFRPGGSAEVVGRIRNRIKLMPGMHPKVIAGAHHVGHWQQGPVASDRPLAGSDAAAGHSEALADADIPGRIWWSVSQGGPGNGVHLNDAMPINPAPLIGGQNWYDNLCRVTKI